MSGERCIIIIDSARLIGQLNAVREVAHCIANTELSVEVQALLKEFSTKIQSVLDHVKQAPCPA